jgi:integrase
MSLGRCPKPYLLFCLDTKKEAKKVKTAPVSLEKSSFGRLKSSNLLKFDFKVVMLKRHGTNFNFGQGRFLTAFLTYFSAHRPRSKVEKWVVLFACHITLHRLRHSYAIDLLESETDVRYLQNLLRPKSSKTTEIYTHVN